MIKLLKKILFLIPLILIISELKAQDVEFSEFYANKIYLNPAFTGSDYDSRLSLTYRNQWPEINKAFITYSAAYDQYVDVLQGGLGVHVLQDKQGDGTINTSMISAMYAYNLNITRDLIFKMGFQTSYIQRKLDYTDFTFPDMIDDFYLTGLINPYTTETYPTSLTKTYIDYSSGILLSYKNIFFGLAAHHLTEPNEAFKEESDYSILPTKYTLHCGWSVPMFRRGLRRADYTLSPNFLMQQQGTNRQLNYGIYLTKGPLIIGSWYRDNLELEYDAIILQVGIIQSWWQFSYSYDKTVSKLIHTKTGAHEISLLLRFANRKSKKTSCKEVYKRRKRRVGAIKCPSF